MCFLHAGIYCKGMVDIKLAFKKKAKVTGEKADFRSVQQECTNVRAFLNGRIKSKTWQY